VVAEWVAFISSFHNNKIMEEDDVIHSLAALAQSARLQVFRALVVTGPQGLTPGALADALGVPASTLSFHLKELMYAGMISQQRDGRNLIYRASFERMNALLGYLTENCCQGAACVDETATACKC
jgi:ArsR family transcriptional regulator, arsenate/arsenite/antimonite-responsive transcriptional repressor